jgi:hypothetical protein
MVTGLDHVVVLLDDIKAGAAAYDEHCRRMLNHPASNPENACHSSVTEIIISST